MAVDKDDLAQTARQLDARLRSGAVAEVDPEDAAALGAFEDHALSWEAAVESACGAVSLGRSGEARNGAKES